MSMDSNDFDSMDHTDGHLFDDVFPGNGLVQDPDSIVSATACRLGKAIVRK